MKGVPSFSILETIIAIAILAGALTAALGLLSFTLRNIRTVGNELIAGHLAAEGIEVLRNLRDENWLKGFAWDAWRSTVSGKCYEVVWNTTQSTLNAGCTNSALQVDAMGHYCYSCGGAATLYTRKVEIESLTTPTEVVRVRSTVSWMDPVGPRNITVEDVLYDWK